MAAANTVSTAANYMKRVYTMPETTAQVVKANPTLKMLKRDGSKLCNGEAFYITVKTHEGYGTYNTWETGSGYNYRPSTNVRYLIDTPVYTYCNVDFSNELLSRNEKSENMLLNIFKDAVKDSNNKVSNSLERAFWAGDSRECLGTTTADPGVVAANASFTLAVNAKAIYNVEVGMKLGFNDDEAGAGDGLVATCYVTAKDIGALTLTCTAITACTSLTGADYIFLLDGASTTGANSLPVSPSAKHRGFQSWIPSAAPSDSFLGVTRTGLGEAVYGWRFTFQGSIEESIKNAMVQMGRHVTQNLRDFYFCMGAGDWYTLEQELGQRVVRDPAASQTVGTEVINVRTPFGLVKCIVIPCLTDGRCFGVDFSSWTLHHDKGIPHIVDEDGQTLRLNTRGAVDSASANDGVQMVLRARTFFTCEAPIRNCTIALT